jgi:hypothetical protein
VRLARLLSIQLKLVQAHYMLRRAQGHLVWRIELAILARARSRLRDGLMGHRIYRLSVLCKRWVLHSIAEQNACQFGPEPESTPAHRLSCISACELSMQTWTDESRIRPANDLSST